jgi:hypothetical protein
VTRVDADGLEWHNPGVVWVDPEFRGEVWVVGEPDETWGAKQTLVRIMPGQMSHPGFDVDLVYIIMPDGSRKYWFIMGRGYAKNAAAYGNALIDTRSPDAASKAKKKASRANEYYWVDKFGDLHSSDTGLTIIGFDPGSGLWPNTRWRDDTKKAKKNPCPRTRMPFDSSKPPWARS